MAHTRPPYQGFLELDYALYRIRPLHSLGVLMRNAKRHTQDSRKYGIYSVVRTRRHAAKEGFPIWLAPLHMPSTGTGLFIDFDVQTG